MTIDTYTDSMEWYSPFWIYDSTGKGSMYNDNCILYADISEIPTRLYDRTITDVTTDNEGTLIIEI